MTTTPEMIVTLRDRLTTQIIDDVGRLLVQVSHPHSGRVIESVMQMLPDDTFKMLAIITIGNETDEFVEMLMGSILVRLVEKQYIKMDSREMYDVGIRNMKLLVNIESLRRQDYMTYLWPEDFFKPNGDVKFAELTASGKIASYEAILLTYQGGTTCH